MTTASNIDKNNALHKSAAIKKSQILFFFCFFLHACSVVAYVGASVSVQLQQKVWPHECRPSLT